MILPFNFEVVTEIGNDDDDYVYVLDEEFESGDKSEIALCTLSAINWGRVKDPTDFEKPCSLAIRALDELLDYQNYPVLAAKNSTMNRRPLGVGIINLAYWLAKNDLTYQNITDEGLAKVHEYAEAWSYYLIKASVDLAKEKGACPRNNETKYSLGIMPIDTYKRDVDELVVPNYKMDWDTLRQNAKQYGVRNSTVMALMPGECQSKDNKMLLADGSVKTLGEILVDSGVDIEWYETNQMVGERINIKPIDLPNGRALQAYYNGVQPVYEINIEGDTYKFTSNHLLLVKTNIGNQWIQVDQLEEGMEIVSFED